MNDLPYQVTIVSHTHWDREWYRPFQEFRLQLVALIDRLLDILDQDEGYRSFLLDGQTIVLEDYLELRPEREGDLRRQVKAGRLFVGPWFILPDEFLVGAEATIRNLLLGARIAERFGGRMRVGYIPDPFGHIGQLPQILVGFDIHSAVFQRGLADEPTELWWEAPDGARLLTIYLRNGYGNLAWAPTTLPAFAHAVETQIKQLAPYTQTGRLLLLNGTDHMLPQPELPALIAAANRLFAGHAQIEHGNLPDYIDAVRQDLADKPELPVIRGEQHSPRRFPILSGVFSARMWIKQRNFTGEQLLTGYVEPLNAMTTRLGKTNQTNELWQAWRYLLQNHPHDSICGCSVDQVHEEMRLRFDWVEQIARSLAVSLLQSLAEQIDSRLLPALPILPEPHPPTYSAHYHTSDPVVMVYNPTMGRQSGYIELAVPSPMIGHHQVLLAENGTAIPGHWSDSKNKARQRTLRRDEIPELLNQITMGFYAGRLIRDVRLWLKDTEARMELVLPEYHTGEIGNFAELAQTLPKDPAFQRVERLHLTAYWIDKQTVRFIARDVPGVGYQAYRLQSIPGEPAATPLKMAAGQEIENEYFRVAANANAGTLTVTDKAIGATYTDLNRFVDSGDRGDEYNYCPPETDSFITAPIRPPVFERIDEGELGQRLRISAEYQIPARLGDSRTERAADLVTLPIETEVRLVPGVRRIDIRATVENRGCDHRLRVVFPTGLNTTEALVDGHFDRLRRRFEKPLDTVGWAEQPQPTQHMGVFVAAREGNRGFLLAARGLPEYELIEEDAGATLALTLLRCVGWLSREDLHCRPGHAGPELATPGAQCPGRHLFEYSLLPFAEDFDETAQRAYAFAAPLLAVVAPAGNGALPPRQALITVEPAAIVLTSIKVAEDGHGLIVRCYNSSESTVKARLTTSLSAQQLTETNLLERPIGATRYPEGNSVFTMDIAPKHIVTWRLE